MTERKATESPPGFDEAFRSVASNPNSEEAWRELFRVADSPLRSFISKRLGNDEKSDIDDTLATTWERLFVRLQRAGSVVFPESPWFYVCRAARNVVLDRARRISHRPPAEGLVINATDASSANEAGSLVAKSSVEPLAELIASELAGYLQARLKPREWSIIADSLAGYELSEIAERQGISEQNVRQIKHRARIHAQAILIALNQ